MCSLDTRKGRGRSPYAFGAGPSWTTAVRVDALGEELNSGVTTNRAERTRTPMKSLQFRITEITVVGRLVCNAMLSTPTPSPRLDKTTSAGLSIRKRWCCRADRTPQNAACYCYQRKVESHCVPICS